VVIGDHPSLGQMKEQYAEAAAAGTSGSVLHKAFHRSFAVTKRVRTETGIASKGVSVASVADSPARSSRRSPTTVMLIGRQDDQLVARHLKARGTGDIVTARTFDHAVTPARVRRRRFRSIGCRSSRLPTSSSAAGAADHLVGPSVMREGPAGARAASDVLHRHGVPRLSIPPSAASTTSTC
jgi:glutamyl-tRNA reductase